jgi:bifunctional UDP-N-acetylglucosamine pyrophosphorylase/glucosamine-1-phosphate N-acetyltransferase
MKRLIVVLAAGQGTRMKSPLAKVLHPLLGRPVLTHVLESLRGLEASRILVVVGHQREAVEPLLVPFGARAVVQSPQLGTGHALMCCRDVLEAEGPAEVLLVAGDVPLLPVDDLARFWDAFGTSGAPAALVGVRLPDPSGYGRLVRDEGGTLCRIVEEKDAGPAERSVREVNSGVYFLKVPDVLDHLQGLGRANAQNEYYLTDLVAALYKENLAFLTFDAADPEPWLGINTQAELARATRALRHRIIESWMALGTTVMDPDTAWIESGVSLGLGVVLHPFVKLCGNTALGRGVEVRSFSSLTDCVVGDETLIKENCVLEKTVTGPGCIIGPFSRTREGTDLGPSVHLGNFVETKKAVLGRGVKANHLSYLGDAAVGPGSNIGAGTITCNYDGVNKHRTVLGERVFVGSDTQLVAPVTVGDGAYIGAGTTITKDVPAESLAVSRAPQKNIRGWASRKKAPPKKD